MSWTTIDAGATWLHELRYQSNGVDVDLTGCSAICQARPVNGGDALFTISTTANSIEILGARVLLKLSAQQTGSMAAGVYNVDVLLTWPNGEVERIGRNTVEVSEGVTSHVTHRSEISVMQYGAVGDGITDDTDAFNAAISAADSGGGIVVIPGGRYAVNLSISTSNLILMGTAPYGGYGLARCALVPSNPSLPVVQVRSADNSNMVVGVALQNLCILAANGRDERASIGLSLERGTYRFSSQNLWIQGGFTDTGMRFYQDAASRVPISYVMFSNTQVEVTYNGGTGITAICEVGTDPNCWMTELNFTNLSVSTPGVGATGWGIKLIDSGLKIVNGWIQASTGAPLGSPSVDPLEIGTQDCGAIYMKRTTSGFPRLTMVNTYVESAGARSGTNNGYDALNVVVVDTHLSTAGQSQWPNDVLHMVNCGIRGYIRRKWSDTTKDSLLSDLRNTIVNAKLVSATLYDSLKLGDSADSGYGAYSASIAVSNDDLVSRVYVGDMDQVFFGPVTLDASTHSATPTSYRNATTWGATLVDEVVAYRDDGGGSYSSHNWATSYFASGAPKKFVGMPDPAGGSQCFYLDRPGSNAAYALLQMFSYSSGYGSAIFLGSDSQATQINIGRHANDAIGFYGGARRTRRVNAAQVAITDGSGGTASDAIAAISDTATKNAVATLAQRVNEILTALGPSGVNLIKGSE